ncbi:MAG: DUF3293 domain-containing protein [Zoogloeaceae bacterium]|jgi:hypothetical protein|nr:DUF3293 domain-containing protein [Zoogloeaceae bacterium]
MARGNERFSPALLRAYRATAYRIYAHDMVFTARVNEPASFLEGSFFARKTRSWAILTAWNPHSQLRARQENLRAQQALLYVLRRMGFAAKGRIFPGENFSDGGAWPPEATVFIRNLCREKARELARAFGQNAFLWARRGGKSQLIFAHPSLGGRGRCAYNAKR